MCRSRTSTYTVPDNPADPEAAALRWAIGVVIKERMDSFAARVSPLPNCSAARIAQARPRHQGHCHVTLGRERPSGSICDSLAANGGGKYLPTYVRRVLAVS